MKSAKLTAVIVLLAFCTLASGQIISSSIVGTVTDASGAGVPHARITVTNEGTGISVEAETDGTGAYSVPNLQPGTYTVAAQKEGFATFRATGFQVLAEQSVRVNARLPVSSVDTSVSVVGETPLVKTESATIGGTITSHVMEELPLAQQSIDALMALVPGAQVTGQTPQTGGGMHFGSFNFTINGTQSNDNGNGAGAYSFGLGLISQPAVSSLQEFKVEAYNTNAEYKDLGTITMVTKAGTNGLHGEVYEYNQNKSLNANTFLNNANGRVRPPFIRNQFGVNAGGPIKKNKAFFFANYSGLRNHTYSNVSLTFPGAAMRQGDFSALCSAYNANGVCTDTGGTQLYNPFTGQPFSNNRIPSNLITPQAQKLNTFLPLPTQAINAAGLPNGGINYFGLVGAVQTTNEADLRIDYQLTPKDQLYGVYNRNVGDPWGNPLGTPPTYGNGGNYGYRMMGYSFAETHTFNPRMLNEFHFSYFDPASIRSGQNLDFDPHTLFPQLPQSPNRGLPAMSIAGYTGMFTDIGLGFYNHTFDLEYVDNFTLVKGRHTIKVGADIATYKSYQPNPGAPLGTFSFNGQWTGNKGWPGQPTSQGNAYADFLLGTVNVSTSGNPNKLAAVYWCWDYNFYAQDTWQASSHLTLYYGFRYMYQTPWHWQGDYSTYWDPATNRLALPQDSATATFPQFGASPVLFAAYNFTTTQALGRPKFYMIGDKKDLAPRLGLAYRLGSDNRTVIRAGYGIYYNFNPAFAGPRDDVLNPPWLSSLTGFANSSYSTQLPGTPTAPFQPDVTFANPFPSNLSTAAGASLHPNVYYVQPDLKHAMVQQWTATLERQFTSNWAGRITYAGSQTHHSQWFFGDFNVPAKQIPNVTTANQRPYQPWNTILSTRSGASQNFEQMQLEATKRYSNGFTFQAEYAWTRSLDNADYSGGPMIPQYPGLDYGNSVGVRRHSFVFHYVYELPFGRGRQLLSHGGKALDAVVGGWQVSGISNYVTGAPFSVSFAVPSNIVGWWGGRADAVAGSNLYAKGSGHNVLAGVPWFNTAAFAPPQPWQWGNSSRNMLFGPGSWNWDISAAKSVRIRERAAVQLRADFLDAFNHFNLGGPSAQIADTRDGGTPIATSGKIFGGSGSRVVQVGARVTF